MVPYKSAHAYVVAIVDYTYRDHTVTIVDCSHRYYIYSL